MGTAGAHTPAASGAGDDQLIAAFSRAVVRELPDARVLLIGSRARGDNRPDSDYDFIVISRAFEGIALPWRGQALYQAWANVLPPVDADIICRTPEEYERGRTMPTSWIGEADREAVSIWPEREAHSITCADPLRTTASAQA